MNEETKILKEFETLENLEPLEELKALEELREDAYYEWSYSKISKQSYLTLKVALKRNEPMKPIYEKDGTRSCPCCKANWLTPNFKFCSDCGQKLDWSDDNE